MSQKSSMSRLSVGRFTRGDVREITFSSKIGRHEQEFHTSSMLSELSGTLVRA